MHNLKRLALIIIPLSLPAASIAAPATPDDYDGDGLPNAAELRIAEQFGAHGFPAVSATNAYSLGQAVPDYFLPVGRQYLGAMFTDHDLLPDDWERQYGLSTIAFDTWLDHDSDGWCNYAEYMATTDPASLTNAPVPTIAVRAALEHGHDSLYGVALVVRAGRALWRPSATSDGRTWLATLGAPSSGHVDEGPCVIEAWADSNGDGLWTPGEPYGATSADIGWAGTSVDLMLTDISQSILRFDLAALAAARDFATANAATDRGVIGSYYPNEATAFFGTNDIGKVLVRMRIVRSWFNGENTDPVAVDAANGTVFEGLFDLRGHPRVTEADLLAKGLLDLDWGTIEAPWRRVKGSNASVNGLTNVAYRILLGNGTDSGALAVLDNLTPIVFYNAFELGMAQTRTEPVAPAGIVASAQPTFCWKHEAKDTAGRKIKDYPAFRLRVWKQDGTTLVYDSGNLPAPPRSVVDGSYSWTAPIYANMVTPQGQIFSTTNNYKWAVSMLDAKFTTPNTTETKMEFRLETSGALGTISDYGAVKACVRYYGPATVTATASAITNLVRVQAFASPDFTGMPAGEGYVTMTNSLHSTTDATTPNATIIGLKPGTYYLRAFVDSDGDCAWSRWETWGAGRAAVPPPGGNAPLAKILMEDMDTNGNLYSDAWEWNAYGSLTNAVPATGGYETRVNTNLSAQVQL